MGLRRTVHHVYAGDPHRVLAPERVHVPAVALLVVRLGDDALHERGGRRLAQLTRRRAVAADHLGVDLELAGARDPGERQGRGGGEEGVEVEAGDERGVSADRVLYKATVHPGALEDVVVEAEALDPGALAAPRALLRERPAHLLQRSQPVEVDALRRLGPHKRVLVGIDEARHDGGPARVDDLGIGVAVLAHLGVVADRQNHSVPDRDRRSAGTLGVQRPHPGPHDRKISEAAHAVPPPARPRRRPSPRSRPSPKAAPRASSAASRRPPRRGRPGPRRSRT